MAGLPMGGGKGVILADEGAAKTPELLAAFGRAVESLGGAYVTAEDVGITDADMVEIAKHRSEEHTSELQALMRISYAVFCLKKKKKAKSHNHNNMDSHN